MDAPNKFHNKICKNCIFILIFSNAKIYNHFKKRLKHFFKPQYSKIGLVAPALLVGVLVPQILPIKAFVIGSAADQFTSLKIVCSIHTARPMPW